MTEFNGQNTGGENNGMAKLTNKNRNLLIACKGELSAAYAAKKFKVSVSTVYKVWQKCTKVMECVQPNTNKKMFL